MFMTGFNERGLFDNLFNEILGGVVPESESKPERNFSLRNIMQTDILEDSEGYKLMINLPGYKKENIEAIVEGGYLTITAKEQEDKLAEKDTTEADSSTVQTENNSKKKYVCRERFTGDCKRSFHVGNNVTRNDIKASFENGVLEIYVPKKNNTPKEERMVTID